MAPCIRLKLYASLKSFAPASGEDFPIIPGMTVRELLAGLNLPEEKIALIFIDGVRSELTARLAGGERVGIFPPVGGG